MTKSCRAAKIGRNRIDPTVVPPMSAFCRQLVGRIVIRRYVIARQSAGPRQFLHESYLVWVWPDLVLVQWLE
jgi:hypothetical protein